MSETNQKIVFLEYSAQRVRTRLEWVSQCTQCSPRSVGQLLFGLFWAHFQSRPQSESLRVNKTLFAIKANEYLIIVLFNSIILVSNIWCLNSASETQTTDAKSNRIKCLLRQSIGTKRPNNDKDSQKSQRFCKFCQNSSSKQIFVFSYIVNNRKNEITNRRWDSLMCKEGESENQTKEQAMVSQLNRLFVSLVSLEVRHLIINRVIEKIKLCQKWREGKGREGLVSPPKRQSVPHFTYRRFHPLLCQCSKNDNILAKKLIYESTFGAFTLQICFR